MRQGWTTLLLASAGVWSLAAAVPARAETPLDILIRSVDPNASYTGDQETRELQGPGGRPARPRPPLQQKVYRKGTFLRIEFKRGPVLFDDGKLQRRYLPGPRIVETSPSQLSPAVIAQQRRALRRRAVAEQVGTDTVAGRSATVIQMKDARANAASRKVWVDRETYVQLRQDITFPNGRAVSTYFTSFTPGDPPAAKMVLDLPPDVLEVPKGLGRPVPALRAAALARAWGGPLLPRYLPGNYTFKGYFLSRFKGQDVLVAVYQEKGADNTLSVFQGPVMGMSGPGTMPADKPAKLHVLSAKKGSADVTVVAPLSDDEMKRVMDSIPD